MVRLRNERPQRRLDRVWVSLMRWSETYGWAGFRRLCHGDDLAVWLGLWLSQHSWVLGKFEAFIHQQRFIATGWFSCLF